MICIASDLGCAQVAPRCAPLRPGAFRMRPACPQIEARLRSGCAQSIVSEETRMYAHREAGTNIRSAGKDLSSELPVWGISGHLGPILGPSRPPFGGKVGQHRKLEALTYHFWCPANTRRIPPHKDFMQMKLAVFIGPAHTPWRIPPVAPSLQF